MNKSTKLLYLEESQWFMFLILPLSSVLLPQTTELWGKRCFPKMGIPVPAWFVTIFVSIVYISLTHRILALISSSYAMNMLSYQELLPSSSHTCSCCRLNSFSGRWKGWSTQLVMVISTLALCILENISDSFILNKVLSYTAMKELGCSFSQRIQLATCLLPCLYAMYFRLEILYYLVSIFWKL